MKNIYNLCDGKIYLGDYLDMFSEGVVYVSPSCLEFSDKKYNFLKLSPLGNAGNHTKIDDDSNITVREDLLKKAGLEEGTRAVYKINGKALDIWNFNVYLEMLPQISEYVGTLKGKDEKIIDSISFADKSLD